MLNVLAAPLKVDVPVTLRFPAITVDPLTFRLLALTTPVVVRVFRESSPLTVTPLLNSAVLFSSSPETGEVVPMPTRP